MAIVDRTAEELALRSLAGGYAIGLDEGDGERVAKAFRPDGNLHFNRALDAPEFSTTTGSRGAGAAADVHHRPLRPEAAFPGAVRLLDRHR